MFTSIEAWLGYFDAVNRRAMRDAAHRIVQDFGCIDLAVYCAGTYKPMRATSFDLDEALRQDQVNYGGALHLLDAVLPLLLRQRSGHLSLVSSVSGYRGLPKALAYGPTKAALNNLAEVLYFDLRSQGLGISIVNPGFVETPLTAQNDFVMPALMTPEAAAEAIVRGWSEGRFEMHFPRRFTWGLKALQHASHRLYFAAVRRATGL